MLELAKIEDLNEILAIFKEASIYLKQKNIDQWQDGYPNETIVKNDILLRQCYIFKVHDSIIGVVVLTDQIEETYNQIDGSWLSKESYRTIHRLAVKKDSRGEGISSKILRESEKMTKKAGKSSIRVDTHKDNFGMQKLLKTFGYTYCGIISLADGNLRNAYEKMM